METNWQKFKFLLRKMVRQAHHKRVKGVGGKALRVLGALMLLATLFGPMPYAPLGGPTPTASADLLKWDDLRPVYTDIRDTTGPYTALPAFGTLAALSTVGAVPMNHPVVVAPNGDLFTAGKPATGTAPNVYKSTDGGLTWQASNNAPGDAANVFPAGVRIVGIAVAPKYPQDNRVYAVYTDDVVGDDANDGVAISTTGGNTFVILCDGAAGGAGACDLDLTPTNGAASTGAASVSAIAISPDFDGATSAGEVAIGLSNSAAGLAVASIRLTGAGLFSGTAAPTVTSVINAANLTAGSAAAILSMAYSPGEVTRLAALVGVTGGVAGTHVIQRDSATTWPAFVDNDATELSDTIAVAGKVAFADTYTVGGVYYAGWTDGAAAAAAGVYKFDGTTWAQLAGTGAPVGIDITDIAVSGSGSTATILAVEGAAANTRIYKSTNAGSSFTNRNYAGQDPVTAITAVAAARAGVAVPKDYATSGKAYVTTNAVGGGVLSSTNFGVNWAGTMLTNATCATTSESVGTGETWFALCGARVFKSTNFSSSSAGWREVERTVNVGTISPVSFSTTNTVFLRRTAAGDTQLLKSTDGGESFGTSGITSPDSNTLINTLSCLSVTQCWAGMADGKVFITTTGGSSWDAGRDIGDNVRQFARSPNFATDNIIFAEVDISGSTEILKSTDGGATFPTKVGSSSGAWGSGTGTGSISFYAKDTWIFYRPASPAAAMELWRFNDGTSTQWEKIGSPVRNWGTMRISAATGIGDGLLMQILDQTNNNIVYTWNPITVTTGTWTKLVTANAALGGIVAPAFAPTSFSGDSITGGTRLRAIAGGRVGVWTDTTGYLGKATLNTPLNNSNVSTNVGDNGIPLTMTWGSIDRAQCYDVQIALDAAFNIPILDSTTAVGICPAAAPANPALVVAQAAAALSQGNTYYWRVRVRGVGPSTAAADLSAHAGPWSDASKFAVASMGAPTAPAPSLPIDGSTTITLGPSLSWNNPAGTTQVHVQVSPLNDDGPGVNLIIGSAINSYSILPPVFGTGNYVMLPGATYTWRVRTTNASTSVGVDDPSWGPWSEIRTFKTPKPNAGTISLLDPIGGATATSKKPALTWKDSASSNFYYEVQLSSDPNFGTGPQGAIAAVQHQLVHGGVSSPPNSYASPTDLAAGTYYWRVRQRVQATALGPDETGISWTPSQSFKVP